MKQVATAIITISLLNSVSGMAQQNKVLPHAVVYKTKADYSHLVPVTLSDDGSRIVSYPAIEDIRASITSAKPTQLANSYLLDNAGRIGKHVAFLKLSYEQYSKLDKLPSLKELYAMLIDKKPLTALYDCGLKAGPSSEKKLNSLIRNHKLGASCKKMN